MNKLIVLEGICHSYSEQGIGPHYAFWESKHIHPQPGTWDFAGLHILKNGDHLTIFDKKISKKIVWSGFISLWTDRIGRIHQRDISRKKWTRWFGKEYPAKLTLDPNQKRPE